MSGDMRIKQQVDGGMTARMRGDDIDAHSQSSGDFTQQRSIMGKQVFLTSEGAQAFDDKVAKGYRFEAANDPKGFFDKLADKMTNAPEKFSGKVAP